MKYSWRLFHLRAQLRSQLHISSRSSHFQVQSNANVQAIRYFSSLLCKNSFESSGSSPIFVSPFTDPSKLKFIITRGFSSEPALEQKESDHVVVSDIFIKSTDANEIRKCLDLNGTVFSHELVLKVLEKLEQSPNAAIRFFDWVVEHDSERLSSKSYNLMLQILGVNGLVKEFWDLTDAMKKKGYGISKGTRDKVLEKFERGGLDGEVEKLRSVFESGSTDNSMEKVCSRVCKIIRSKVWDDDVESQLRDMNVKFSSDMVKIILENLGTDPTKALIFFRWMDEAGMVKHDEQTYNAMARVLGREDCIDRFWKVVDEMRSIGHEIEAETYVKVLGRFCKRKMIEDAVNLCEFAMAGVNKPSVDCCTFLMRKIVVAKHLDIGLFSRVAKTFTKSGNVLTNSMLSAVLKSLSSVGRLGKCNQILKAVEECGFLVTGDLQSKVAFRLSGAGKKDEVKEFIDSMQASGCNPDSKTWASLIEGHCLSGDLDEAADSLHKMVEKEEFSSAAYALDVIVNAYCQKNRATDAGSLLCNLVNEKKIRPWHTTYKALISKLLVQGGFKDALKLLPLMKDHGFPPYIEPFIEYVSKSGSGEDAIVFVKAMTSKRFPSTPVFLRMFEGFFTAGRHDDAQNFLSKCPGYIRNHADVLNLFCSKKSGEVTALTNGTS